MQHAYGVYQGIKEGEYGSATKNAGLLFLDISPFLLKGSSRIKALVDKVARTGTDLTQNYRAWFELACSIANSLGENGREYFHQISQFHPTYTRRRTDEEYDKVLKTAYRYSMGTLIHHCRQAGILSAVSASN